MRSYSHSLEYCMVKVCCYARAFRKLGNSARGAKVSRMEENVAPGE